MNKKTIFSTIKIIALGILLSAAFSYAQVPAGNVSKPIHVNSLQAKTGTLGIGPLVVNGISQFYNTVNILGLNPSAPTGVPTAPSAPSGPTGGGGGSPSTFLDKFLPTKAFAGANEICGNGIDDNNNLLIDEGCSSAGYFQVELIGYQIVRPDTSIITYCDPATQNCVSGFTQAIDVGDKVNLKWSVTSVGSITFGYCTKVMNTLSSVPSLGWSGNTSSAGSTQQVAPTTLGVMHQFVLNCYDTGGVWAGLGYTNIYIKNQGDLNVKGKMSVGLPSPIATLDINGSIRIGNSFGGGANPGVCATNTGHLLSC